MYLHINLVNLCCFVLPAGFNTMMDLAYPLTTQTIVTDGQTFSFYAYQLNTLALWRGDEANPLRNICWHSNDAKLFEVVEDGEVYRLQIYGMSLEPPPALAYL
jgi:hypothetical protein